MSFKKTSSPSTKHSMLAQQLLVLAKPLAQASATEKAFVPTLSPNPLATIFAMLPPQQSPVPTSSPSPPSDDPDPIQVLLSWLTHHVDYDPSFWTTPMDKGMTPWMMLADLLPLSASLSIWPHISNLVQDNMLTLLNTPNPHGQVMLHVLWEKFRQESFKKKLLVEEAVGRLCKVMENTHPRFWTFLDKPGQPKGLGWRLEMLDLIKVNDVPEWKKLTDLVKAVSSKYPLNEHERDSNLWLESNGALYHEALLAMGYTWDDMVVASGVSFPVWKWKWAKDVKTHHSQNILQSAVGHLSKAAHDEMQSMNDELKEWSDKLVPDSYRSTTGYIKKVLETKGADPVGRTSLDYLLAHRNDLWPKFKEMTNLMSPAQLTTQFDLTDQWGYTALDRVLCASPAIAPQVLEWVAQRGLPWKTSLLEQGALAFPMAMSPDDHQIHQTILPGNHQAMSPYRYQDELKLGNIDVLATMPSFVQSTPPAHVFFGPPSQQQQWSEKWEHYLRVLQQFNQTWPSDAAASHPTSTVFLNLLQGVQPSSPAVQFWKQLPPKTRQDIVMSVLLFARYPQWRQDLDPTLCAQLSLGLLLLTNHTDLILKEVAFIDVAGKYASLKLNKGQGQPPNVWTPSMLEVVQDKDVFNQEKLSESKALLPLWTAAAEHHVLTKAIVNLGLSASSTPPRRM